MMQPGGLLVHDAAYVGTSQTVPGGADLLHVLPSTGSVCCGVWNLPLTSLWMLAASSTTLLAHA